MIDPISVTCERVRFNLTHLLIFEQVLVYSPDGRCLFRYSAYDNALGLKTVAWSPCGQFLGCGSYDQVVRALNHLTFKPVVEFSHPFVVKGILNAVVFKVRTTRTKHPQC